MSEDRQEIGYFNNSTKQVIPGFNALFHSLSKGRNDVDKNGQVRHVENIAGSPREIMLNLKGQFKLDNANRGGARLWVRIYDAAELNSHMEKQGVTVVKKEDAVEETILSEESDESEAFS